MAPRGSFRDSGQLNCLHSWTWYLLAALHTHFSASHLPGSLLFSYKDCLPWLTSCGVLPSLNVLLSAPPHSFILLETEGKWAVLATRLDLGSSLTTSKFREESQDLRYTHLCFWQIRTSSETLLKLISLREGHTPRRKYQPWVLGTDLNLPQQWNHRTVKKNS